MIYIGDQKLKSCYLGDEKIRKVYRGDELLFAQKATHNLPQGYTELEYVEATGAQYIDWVSPGTVYIFSIDVELETNTAALYFWGYSAASSTSTPAYLNYKYTKSSEIYTITSCIGKSGTTSVQIADKVGKRIHIVQNKINKTLTIDDEVYDITVNSLSTSTSKCNLFANKYYGSTTTTMNGAAQNMFRGKIYGWQISNSAGEIAYNNVPCIQDSTGIAGFYDIQTNVFRKSSSTTNFVAGPAL